MADAVRMETWDLQAWVCFHIPRFSGGHNSWQQYNPLRRRQNESSAGMFMSWGSGFIGNLPAKLSEDEIESQWRGIKKAKANGK